MLPVSNRGTGGNVGFPDVCLTPPVAAPIPYVNTSFNATAVTFSPTVYWTMMNGLNLGSVLATSTGDEPGVMHWTIKGPAVGLTGSPTVFLNGLPARTLCHLVSTNTANDMVAVVTIPSAVAVLVGYAAPGAEATNGDPYHRTMTEASQVLAFLEPLAATGSAVESALLERDIGYVALRVFSADAPGLVFTALRTLAAQGMSALVIDLRGCPGGEVSAALELAGDFLEPGTVLITSTDGDGDDTVYRARPGEPHRLPMAILVDRETASAAELFAGCLKAHGRAVIVGETTYGKGVGQALRPAHEGPQIECATIARFTLPNGEAIHGVGVRPDIEAPREGGCAIEVDRTLLLTVRDRLRPLSDSDPKRHCPSR